MFAGRQLRYLVAQQQFRAARLGWGLKSTGIRHVFQTEIGTPELPS